MPLISIADLKRPEAELAPILDYAKTLGELWLEFVKQDDESYEYTVKDDGEKERSAGIHASEMSDCMTKVVYSILGTERRVDPQAIPANMKLRFRTGTAIHAMIQTDFERMAAWYSRAYQSQGLALSFERELNIKPELQAEAEAWGLSSHCDGLFTFWRWYSGTEGQHGWDPFLRIGTEIKTSSDKMFEDRKKPEAKHLEQTCLYQACLDIPLMWVLYYNKSNSNFTTPYSPWLFKFDEHLWKNELEMRFAKAHHHAETRQMPARSEGNHCGWCPFTWICKPKILERQKNGIQGAPYVSTGLVRRP